MMRENMASKVSVMTVAFALAAACVLMAGCGGSAAGRGNIGRATSYLNTYGGYKPSDLAGFRKYDVAVLDPYDYPDESFPTALRKSGTTVLAYIDIGEAEEFRDYWPEVRRNPGILIKENPDWPGDWFADVNNPQWRRIILEREIPRLQSLGPMDGLCMDMLDTVDDYPRLKPGMVQLVAEIRRKYPGLLLVPNRGFAVLPEILPYIDAFKYEDLSSGYDAETKTYKAERDLGDEAVLARALARKKMPVLVLDHVATSPPDVKMARADYVRSVQVASRMGAHFVWYANSVAQDHPGWPW